MNHIAQIQAAIKEIQDAISSNEVFMVHCKFQAHEYNYFAGKVIAGKFALKCLVKAREGFYPEPSALSTQPEGCENEQCTIITAQKFGKE